MAFAARRVDALCSLSSRVLARRSVSSQLNGITIEHTSMGDKKNPAVLLIMGHSATMTLWRPIDQRLTDAGFHVIKFDNRDMGLTQRFDDVVPDPAKHLAGGANPLEGAGGTFAYCIDDMADDAMAVLDHYGVDKAHVVGTSMGGLITQVVGVRYAARCKSLTPIMTAASLNGAVGKAIAKDGGAFMGRLMAAAANSPGKNATLEQFLENRLSFWPMMLSDPSWPVVTDDGMLGIIKEAMTIDYGRGGFDYDGNGANRQSLAVNEFERSKLPAHIEGLKQISCPTLVLHGIHDPIIPIETGRELAATIPGARIVEYLGGHSFGNHPTVMETMVSAVVEHITAAENLA